MAAHATSTMEASCTGQRLREWGCCGGGVRHARAARSCGALVRRSCGARARCSCAALVRGVEWGEGCSGQGGGGGGG